MIGGTVLALLAASCSAAGAGVESEALAEVVAKELLVGDEQTATTTFTVPESQTAMIAERSTIAPDHPVPHSVSAGIGAAAQERISNGGIPVFSGDFADPDVVSHDGLFFAYATNTLFMNVPILSTERNGVAGDALPVLPTWSEPHHVWAPSVTEIGDRWLLHYTTRHTDSGRQCISVAVGDDPGGSFVDDSTEPLVCPIDQGGAIDPSVVFDGADPFLLWKSDGNCCGLPTIIYAQALSWDGTEVIGDPVELIRNDLSWERDVVEGPSMIEVGDTWWLFYSANRWDEAGYAVGLAECSSVLGPCLKQAEPWLDSIESLAGPGGLEVISLADRAADLVVYHGWVDGEVGYPDGARALYARLVRWTRDGPVLIGGVSEGS